MRQIKRRLLGCLQCSVSSSLKVSAVVATLYLQVIVCNVLKRLRPVIGNCGSMPGKEVLDFFAG